jgi:hypothetical protein
MLVKLISLLCVVTIASAAADFDKCGPGCEGKRYRCGTVNDGFTQQVCKTTSDIECVDYVKSTEACTICSFDKRFLKQACESVGGLLWQCERNSVGVPICNKPI